MKRKGSSATDLLGVVIAGGLCCCSSFEGLHDDVLAAYDTIGSHSMKLLMTRRQKTSVANMKKKKCQCFKSPKFFL